MKITPILEQWETLSAEKRNTLVGRLMDAPCRKRFYMALRGEFLWSCGIAEAEFEMKQAYLAEKQDTVQGWKQLRAEFADPRIKPSDRGSLTIEADEYHLRYSDTPGGGWMVIEAIKAVTAYNVLISGDENGWVVTCGFPKRSGIQARRETMAEAACVCAIQIFH